MVMAPALKLNLNSSVNRSSVTIHFYTPVFNFYSKTK